MEFIANAVRVGRPDQVHRAAGTTTLGNQTTEVAKIATCPPDESSDRVNADGRQVSAATPADRPRRRMKPIQEQPGVPAAGFGMIPRDHVPLLANGASGRFHLGRVQRAFSL
jgi:hypothetical protein